MGCGGLIGRTEASPAASTDRLAYEPETSPHLSGDHGLMAGEKPIHPNCGNVPKLERFLLRSNFAGCVTEGLA